MVSSSPKATAGQPWTVVPLSGSCPVRRVRVVFGGSSRMCYMACLIQDRVVTVYYSD